MPTTATTITKDFLDRTVIVTGASRGIGKAIALSLAAHGANVVVAAKTTDDSAQKLKGTIHDTASEIEAIGGQALAVPLDVRDDQAIAAMIAATVARFGRIDALVNNAGAIRLEPVAALSPERFDLLWQVNVRAAYACAHYAIPHLRNSDRAHILNLSPPLNLAPHWLAGKTGYTITKYGMSMLTLGLAQEVAAAGIAVNALWPKTAIATAAIAWLLGESALKATRHPAIVADAVLAILRSPVDRYQGQLLTDEEVLGAEGVQDFTAYAVAPGTPLLPDFYIDP